MSTPNLKKSFEAAQAASAKLERRVLRGCLKMFRSVPDPRIDRQKRHRLSDILAIAVLTYMSGGDGFRDMERYGRKHGVRLKAFLELKNGVPSHDTFRRVLSMLRPAVLGVCVRLWQRAAAGSLKGVCVSLDGKAVRRACAKGAVAPVVETAWVDGADVPVGEMRVASKENEIVAIPKLLATLALEGALVTIDAIGCQKEVARAIRAAKAHYLLPLKDNQPTMHAEVLMFMEDLVASGAKGLTFSRHVDKGHGRVEVRRVWHSSDVAWFADRAEWKDLAGFVMVETVRTVNGVDGKPERRCFITSLNADARTLRRLVRRHWGIENRLHWVLDVVFLEDQCRARTGHAPENCSALRKIALTLLRRNAIDGKGVGPMRKECAWDFDSARKVFLGDEGKEETA